MDCEWSHMVTIDKLDASSPLKISISPDEAEKKLLTKRLGVVSLDFLDADLTFVREEGGQVVNVVGELRAGIRQSCVVSAETVTSKISDKFKAWFADPEQAVSLSKVRRDRQIIKGKAEMPMLGEHEDPEPIKDGGIDAGELVTQYLSLAINSYPRAEGVGIEDEAEEVASFSSNKDDNISKNPFAALKDWKDKQG